MKYVYLTVVISTFALNAMAMNDDSTESHQQISQKKPPLSLMNPDGITQEEQALKEEIQNTSQSGIISAWVSLFEQQDIQLDRAQNNPAYVPMNLAGEREVELPVYVLPTDYTLIVAAVGLTSNDVCKLNKETDPRVSAQSTLFWKTRYLNSASIITKELGSYAAAKDFQLNMAFIIEPHKNSIIASASKDIVSPTRDYENAIKFAREKIKLLCKPEDIEKDTHEGDYNEVTLIGPPLFNKLFPNYGPSFTVKGIFVRPQALRQYQRIPSIESHEFLKYLSELTQKNIPIYLAPNPSRK